MRESMQALIQKWQAKANEKRPGGYEFKHSERTVATLRQCADELEAALSSAGPTPPSKWYRCSACGKEFYLGDSRASEPCGEHPCHPIRQVGPTPSPDVRAQVEETPCPKREDRQHCNCWYDGEKCCACGDGQVNTQEVMEARINGLDQRLGALMQELDAAKRESSDRLMEIKRLKALLPAAGPQPRSGDGLTPAFEDDDPSTVPAGTGDTWGPPLRKPVRSSDGVCANCGHTTPHDQSSAGGGPNDPYDACAFPGCNCGYFTPVRSSDEPKE